MFAFPVTFCTTYRFRDMSPHSRCPYRVGSLQIDFIFGSLVGAIDALYINGNFERP